ncbi:hypothetical protein LCGC14_2317490, partial [marine sediment metagenome]
FKATPGERFGWTNHQGARLAGSTPAWKQVQTGTAVADKWGLVTLEGVKVSKTGNKIVIQRQ